MNNLEVLVLKAGCCVHPEKVAIRKGSFRPRQFPALAVLIKHPVHGCILFDTGYTQRFFLETASWPFSLYRKITPVYINKGESVAEQIYQSGIEPGQIRYIFLSHFHADHIGGCNDFPNATFFASQEAYDAVKKLTGFYALRAGYLKNLLPGNFEERLVLLNDDQLVKISQENGPFHYGFDVFHDSSLLLVKLPGHVCGQMGLLIPHSKSGSYFFISDACWLKRSYIKEILPHWLTKLIIDDWQDYRDTLHQIHCYAESHTRVKIVPSHCLETWEEIVDAAKY